MNFQELSLIPTLTVAQNVFLNREEKTASGLIRDAASEQRAAHLFDMLEVSVNPRALVGDLGAGQKQLTEIVKAISQNARVLVLDEPSTALAVSDVDRLFVFLRKLKAQGRLALPPLWPIQKCSAAKMLGSYCVGVISTRGCSPMCCCAIWHVLAVWRGCRSRCRTDPARCSK